MVVEKGLKGWKMAQFPRFSLGRKKKGVLFFLLWNLVIWYASSDMNCGHNSTKDTDSQKKVLLLKSTPCFVPHLPSPSNSVYRGDNMLI